MDRGERWSKTDCGDTHEHREREREREREISNSSSSISSSISCRSSKKHSQYMAFSYFRLQIISRQVP